MSERPKIGAELRAFAKLSLPVALAQLGLVAMSLVDTAIVGHVSTAALGGASLGRSIAFTAITIGMGVATSLEPLASQALGAGDRARAWGALRANLKACLVVSIPALLVGLASTYVLESFGVTSDVARETRGYVIGSMPGQLLTVIFIALKSMLEAQGRTTPIMIGSIIANILNIPLCTALVRGDEGLAAIGIPAIGLAPLGATGAGIAFSLACAILLVFTVVAIAPLRVRGAETFMKMTAVMSLGLPVGLHMLVEYGAFTVVAGLAARIGDAAIGAHQIALALDSFMYMGAFGIGGATAVRVGHEIGRGSSPRRAGFIGIGMGLVFMSAGAVTFAFAPMWLSGLFTSDPAVRTLGATLIRIAAVFQLWDGLQVVSSGALRGAGDVRFPLVANLTAFWLVGLPLAALLAFTFQLGAAGLWMALTFSIVAVAIATTWRFLHLTRGSISKLV